AGGSAGLRRFLAQESAQDIDDWAALRALQSASTAPGLTGVPSSQSVPSAGPMNSMMPPHLETQVRLLLSANHCQIGSLAVGTNVLH
ncbi:MAG TPA: hypothetical protein VFS35_07800, partial [Terrimicrobiaceae bacterium]|nr:hypothetical protein [Terrimicrobiaceae bacterium]